MNATTPVFLRAVTCIALTVVASALAQPASPPITYVQASNVACKVGRANVKPGETVTFQGGGCADGLAQGPGMAQWFLDGKPTVQFAGIFVRGLLERKGTMTGADGDRYEGEFKGGLRHGHGIYVSANGARFEGEYVNNQRGAASAPPSAVATPAPAPQAAQTPAAPAPVPAAPTSKPEPSAPPPTPPSGNFAMVRCEGSQLATVAVATKEPLGLPNDDAFLFDDNGRMPGENQGKAEAVAKSNAVRLVKEAVVFASKNRGANCQPTWPPPIVSEIVLIFKDRIPEKIPYVDKNTAASVPGLLVFADHGSGVWHLYNIAPQREKIAAAQKKEQAEKAVMDEFGKRNKLVDFVPPDKLKANPFAYEGKQVGTVLRFKEMRSSSSAIFSASFILGIGNQILVIDLPKTLFGEEQSAVLAVKVLGTTTIDEPTGKLTVPQLKFLDAIKCRRDDCSDVLK